MKYNKATLKKAIIMTTCVIVTIVIQLLSGCLENSVTITGEITDIRYFGIGFDQYCELTFDNKTKYSVGASGVMNYGLNVGMNVTLVLNKYSYYNGYRIEDVVKNG